MKTQKDAAVVAARVRELSIELAASRPERMARTALDRADFDAIADTGYLMTGVPGEMGGLFESPGRSLRNTCEMVRCLARADPSLALVSAMHPGVLGFWLVGLEPAPAQYADAWRRQREEVFAHVRNGCWFGTMASEPGAGGDLAATRTVGTRQQDGGFALTGDKFMGSGSGVMSFMITTAKANGDDEADLFLLDARDLPWDGSRGLTLVREWDGLGMAATQSHAFRLDGLRTARCAWPGHALDIRAGVLVTAVNTFMAVGIGILDAAIEEARRVLAKRAGRLKAIETTEWAFAENEHWLAVQAYEGSLRAAETGQDGLLTSYRAKLAVACLAEQVFQRLSRALGGISLSRSAPFAQWSQDIKAMGHLRPPWALTIDQLCEAGFTVSQT